MLQLALEVAVVEEEVDVDTVDTLDMLVDVTVIVEVTVETDVDEEVGQIVSVAIELEMRNARSKMRELPKERMMDTKECGGSGDCLGISGKKK